MVVLPVPLTPTIMITSGGAATFARSLRILVQDRPQLLLQQVLQLGAVLNLLPFGVFPQVAGNFR